MRNSILAIGLYLLLSSAHAEDFPGTAPVDARLVELNYDKNQIFRIKVKKNTATRIMLEAGEHIISSATGFASDCKKENNDWCVVANVGDNTLFVKPKAQAQGINNLELTTDRRIYSLELSTVRDSGPTAELPMYRVTFRYPAGGSRAAGAWQWDYTMQALPGSMAIAPSLAFDDGRHTRLKFPSQAELPAIFAVDASGKESPLPLRVDEEGVVVLERVVDDFVLRQGKFAVRVWKGGGGV